jgi:hypothetical protein
MFEKKSLVLLFVSISIAFIACKKDKAILHGNDPNFTIVVNSDNGFSSYNKKVEVFGIPIYAVCKVDDLRLLHAANIMAQYLDNNEDGEIDNPLVLSALESENAFMVMWKKESDLNIDPPNNVEGQDLGNDETSIDWHTNGHTGQFDAALEEVLHIITHAGYANAYPTIFGEEAGSSLSNAMDIARGGQFVSIPNNYPEEAWYHYDDETCEYDCMVTEYMYWALSSLLGAQENRASEISQEWALYSPALLAEYDPIVFDLLTDSQYNFLSILPDGTYKRG